MSKSVTFVYGRPAVAIYSLQFSPALIMIMLFLYSHGMDNAVAHCRLKLSS